MINVPIYMLLDSHDNHLSTFDDVNNAWEAVRCEFGPLSKKPASWDELQKALEESDVQSYLKVVPEKKPRVVTKTPVLEVWAIHYGAIMHNGKKVGSAVLALDDNGELGILVVTDRQDEQGTILPLNQERMEHMVFQISAMQNQIEYRWESSSMVRTDVDHVWYDTITKWFYWYDETDSYPYGPYRTKELAKHYLDLYCKHVLGT